MSTSSTSSTTKTLYEILEIDKSASFNDIKKAYHRLALKYHPDKCVGNGTLTQEYEERFKKVKEAYITLSDPIKKSLYDATLENNNSNQSWNDIIHDVINMMKKILESMYVSSQPIIIKLPVTIEDLYHKRIKKICVKVKRDNGVQSLPLYISLCNYESQYVFERMGDDNIIKSLPRNDIIVKLDIESDSNIHIDNILSKYDIHYDKYISLYEHYYEDNIVIELYGEQIIIEYDRKQKVYTIEKKGIPYYDETSEEECRGDLYIYIHLNLPDVLSLENKDLIRNLFTN